MSSLRLQTKRMLLVAGDLELALAESGDRKKFSELLDADVPANWPPPLNDSDSLQWVINFFKANPARWDGLCGITCSTGRESGV